jgi:hypothetical protein
MPLERRGVGWGNLFWKRSERANCSSKTSGMWQHPSCISFTVREEPAPSLLISCCCLHPIALQMTYKYMLDCDSSLQIQVYIISYSPVDTHIHTHTHTHTHTSHTHISHTQYKEDLEEEEDAQAVRLEIEFPLEIELPLEVELSPAQTVRLTSQITQEHARLACTSRILPRFCLIRVCVCVCVCVCLCVCVCTRLLHASCTSPTTSLTRRVQVSYTSLTPQLARAPAPVLTDRRSASSDNRSGGCANASASNDTVGASASVSNGIGGNCNGSGSAASCLGNHTHTRCLSWSQIVSALWSPIYRTSIPTIWSRLSRLDDTTGFPQQRDMVDQESVMLPLRQSWRRSMSSGQIIAIGNLESYWWRWRLQREPVTEPYSDQLGGVVPRRTQKMVSFGMWLMVCVSRIEVGTSPLKTVAARYCLSMSSPRCGRWSTQPK